MLRLDLAEIIRTPGMYHTYKVNEAPYATDDVEYVSPITGDITVTNTGTMLLVRGPIKTTIAMECNRCLETVRVPIETDIEEQFDLQEMDDSQHHDKVVKVVEEENIGAFEDKVLLLDVLIRQATILAEPLMPLCREDCPGIPVKSTDKDADTTEPLKKSPFSDLSKLLEE
ncbi:hypothetical protein CCAX7_42860 [Capsulimonas corticalis]|uniref:Uncharacterized protein n=1 Tax=Capsulimonas corticalis TaxID=2219043 RepID=A0A402CXR9_9BACT|nr:YceD family protein [Capsulimonas corticalis]BDI32235.1 hypothetical protein CCAX7_42860 [Capsulimonas corticalis]